MHYRSANARINSGTKASRPTLCKMWWRSV